MGRERRKRERYGEVRRGLPREVCGRSAGSAGSARNRGGYFVYNDDQGSRSVTERVRTNLNTNEEHCAPLAMTRGRLVETMTWKSTALEDWGTSTALGDWE